MVFCRSRKHFLEDCIYLTRFLIGSKNENVRSFFEKQSLIMTIKNNKNDFAQKRERELRVINYNITLHYSIFFTTLTKIHQSNFLLIQSLLHAKIHLRTFSRQKHNFPKIQFSTADWATGYHLQKKPPTHHLR